LHLDTGVVLAGLGFRPSLAQEYRVGGNDPGQLPIQGFAPPVEDILHGNLQFIAQHCRYRIVSHRISYGINPGVTGLEIAIYPQIVPLSPQCHRAERFWGDVVGSRHD
jgi:hypothetical protein